MSTNRKTGRIIGILFIIGTVSGILSVALTGTISNSTEYFVHIASIPYQFTLGTLFILLMGLKLRQVVTGRRMKYIEQNLL